ncbi:multidrug resistance protein homolog 49 isoform X2 [Anabrus simplex]
MRDSKSDCLNGINIKIEEINGYKKSSFDVEFVNPEKPAEPPQQKSLSYHQLFRYATCGEIVLVFLGVILSLFTGICFPLIIILYGEFTTLLVDRNMENVTSTPTVLLALFGGGRILVNESWDVRRDAMMEDSRAIGIGCVVVAVVQFILGVSAVSCLNYSAHMQIGRVRRLFLTAILRQDMAWFDTNNSSMFASRLTEDLDKLQDGIGEKLAMFMYLLVSFIASVIMSFLHGWKLTLVVLSCAPVIIIATAVVAKVQSSLTAKEMESYGAAGAVAEEVLSTIRTVTAFSGQQKEVDRYSENLIPSEQMGIKRGLFSGLGGGIFWFIVYCSYSLAFWYGVELIIEARSIGSHEYTPAVLIIVLFGVLAGAMNMGLASPYLEAFAVARGAAAAVFSVIEQKPNIDSLSEEGLRPADLKGDIELKDVHFQYPARPEIKVLQGLNLTIKRGETVALVGSSGCGKSTVVQLIQRLYDPAQGTVSVDGNDMKLLNVSWLRHHIGVVGQEPVLFATSIKENIRYGREDATEQEIEEAAKEANAHDFIMKLPQRYDTLVGERGTQLSGGQKQRIAIARALVRKPGILLLDEATSALDLHSEAKVQNALERASQGRTTIIVAHRLSTIRDADRIVCLSSGRVIEEGTHSELLALKGHYYDLVNASGTQEEAIEDQQQQLEEDGKGDFLISSLTRCISTPAARKASQVTSPPPAAEEEEENYDAPFGRIMGLNKPEWAHNLVGCIAAAVVGATLPFFAVLFGEVYGVLSLQDPDQIRQKTSVYSILFLVVGIMTGLGTFLQLYMFSIAGVKLTNRLRKQVFSAVLQQEIAWFDDERNSVGVLCARLSGDAASVQGATGSRIGSILQSTSTLLIGFILAMYYTWKMTLASVVVVPLVFGAVYLEQKLMHGQGLHEKEALESASKIAVEVISNIRTVAGLAGEKAFIQRYVTALSGAQVAARKKIRFRGVVFAMGQSSWYWAYALSFYYGGYLVAYEDLPYENVIKVSEALIFGAWMLGQSLAFAPNFGTAKMAAGRLFSLMDRKPRIYTSSLAENKKDLQLSGKIQYSKLEFFYPTRPEVTVLRGLDLLVRPGQTVALVGPSGCGKSTCIQLLQRLYDPVAGNVSVDNHDVCTLPLETLRSQLGIVSQEPVLFDRTIAENIAYGDNSRTVPMDEIIAAAKKSNIHSFIAALPQGYETRLGSKGTQLSGGQKQRIAIARALVRNPRILLLDEATSALDNQSEKVVQEALDQAREGRTCITIAHRLATVQQADVIFVLSNGVVAEMGSHSQLLAQGGLYYQMHQQSSKT